MILLQVSLFCLFVFFLIGSFVVSCFKQPLIFRREIFKCLEISFEVRPCHVIKFVLFIARMNVYFWGNLQQCVRNWPVLIFLSRRSEEFAFGVVGEVGYDSDCDNVIVTTQRPSYVLLIMLSPGVLYEVKRMMYFL